jgi:hypothetical protein
MAVSNGGVPDGIGNGADTSAPAPEDKPQSLRDVAEQAWDDLEAEADLEDASESEAPQPRDDGRDERGRWVAKHPETIPGEQTQVPAPAVPPASQQPRPDPAQSNQAPAHWPQAARDMFARQTPEAREYLLERHAAMERDYTQKTQAAATAVEFVQALTPIFSHPDVQRSLVDFQTGQPVHPAEAIRQWTDMHLRAMHPDPRVRAGLARDIMQRMQLDPAAVFGHPQQGSPIPGMTPEDLKDPALRQFADYVADTHSGVAALRNELEMIKRQSAEQQKSVAAAAAKQGIDAFADAVDQQGNRLYPYFDAVLPELMELYHANPGRDLREAYDTACRMSATVWGQIQQSQSSNTRRREDNARAAAAARGNIRGRTAPVVKGDQAGQGQGLRAALEAAADEVGFEG